MTEQQNKFIRIGILGLMLVALVGPWVYEAINVPAEYACTSGVRLDGDFCGIPVSGLQAFVLFFVNCFTSVFYLLTGDSSARELLGSILITLFFLPVFSQLFLIASQTRADGKRQKIHLGILGFALALAAIKTVMDISGNAWGSGWGLLLYEALLVSALGLELFLLRSGRHALTPQASSMI